MKTLCCAGAVLFCCVNVSFADWNQWRGPHRNGTVNDSPELIAALPNGGLKPLWMYTEGFDSRGGWSSPVVADGRVYQYAHFRTKREGVELPPEKFPRLSDDDKAKLTKEAIDAYEQKRRAEQAERRSKLYQNTCTLFCFDAGTGKVIWRIDLDSAHTKRPQSGSPAVVDGRVYWLSPSRQARCVDAKTGKLLWTSPALGAEPSDEQVASSFVIVDGVAVVLADGLFGLDAATGKPLWQISEKDFGGRYSSPVVWSHGSSQYVIVHLQGKETACVDPKSGRELWRVESYAGRSTPVVSGDLLITYGGSRKGGLRCFRLSLEKAEELWKYQRVSDPGASPVIAAGRVFAHGDKRMVCVDLATGGGVWSTLLDVENARYTSLIAADGKVFLAWRGVICVDATADEFRPLYVGKINNEGLLATEDYFRRTLGVDKLPESLEGQKKAAQILSRELGRNTPLDCTSPAISDGKLYLRLKTGVACYDLRG